MLGKFQKFQKLLFILFLLFILPLETHGGIIERQHIEFTNGIAVSNSFTFNGNSVVTTSIMLTTNAIYTFTNTDTSASIQATIDSIPKNLGGKTLELRFASGLYNNNWSSTIIIADFCNGYLYIRGVVETTAAGATNFPTVINMTNTTLSPVFNIQKCGADVEFRHMAVGAKTSANSWVVQYGEMNVRFNVHNTYIFGNGTAGGYLLIGSDSKCVANANVFGNSANAIYSWVGNIVTVYDNIWTNVIPAAGNVTDSGILIRRDAKVLGSTDNVKYNGGQISISASTWY